MEPVSLPVAVVTCCAGHIRKNGASVESARNAPAWKHGDEAKDVQAFECRRARAFTPKLKCEELSSRHEQTFTSPDMDPYMILGLSATGTHKTRLTVLQQPRSTFKLQYACCCRPCILLNAFAYMCL